MAFRHNSADSVPVFERNLCGNYHKGTPHPDNPDPTSYLDPCSLNGVEDSACGGIYGEVGIRWST